MCTKCDAGRISKIFPNPLATGVSDKGGTTCEHCGAGKTAAVGSSVCVPCVAGTELKGTTCTSCGLGQQSRGGAFPCTDCEAGMYGAVDKESCISCLKGRFSTEVKATTNTVCVACAKGRYSSVRGAAEEAACNRCPAGRFGNQEGQPSSLSCQPCR